MIDMGTLRAELIRDEGVRLKPYKDTVGKLTIGIGRNLDDVGISEAEAMAMLDNDIMRALASLSGFPWWDAVKDDPVRARVLVNMCFNLGIEGLRGFVNTLQAVAERRWDDAAAGMRASKWAKQVGARAERLAVMMETGNA